MVSLQKQYQFETPAHFEKCCHEAKGWLQGELSYGGFCYQINFYDKTLLNQEVKGALNSDVFC